MAVKTGLFLVLVASVAFCATGCGSSEPNLPNKGAGFFGKQELSKMPKGTGGGAVNNGMSKDKPEQGPG